MCVDEKDEPRKTILCWIFAVNRHECSDGIELYGNEEIRFE